MKLYKIGYHTCEESGHWELWHEDVFTKEDITDMVAEAIVFLMPGIIDEDYEHTKALEQFFSPYSDEESVINYLVKKKGFVEAKFQEIWSAFGWKNVFDDKSWSGHSGKLDKELTKALKKVLLEEK